MVKGKGIYINIFPNPTNGLVNYGINNFTGIATVKIINNLGETVYLKSVSSLPGQNLELYIKNKPKGSYWRYMYRQVNNTLSTK